MRPIPSLPPSLPPMFLSPRLPPIPPSPSSDPLLLTQSAPLCDPDAALSDHGREDVAALLDAIHHSPMTSPCSHQPYQVGVLVLQKPMRTAWGSTHLPKQVHGPYTLTPPVTLTPEPHNPITP